MTPVASPARQRGPVGTLPQPQAQRRAAVKSSPTGPRAARREAVPLDRHAKRSYPPNQQPHNPQRWVETCDRSVANSETPQGASAARPLSAADYACGISRRRGARRAPQARIGILALGLPDVAGPR
jgi:hypothetical protein